MYLTRHNPAPLNAGGTKLVVIQILIYLVPLLLVSWPAYFYLKGRRKGLP